MIRKRATILFGFSKTFYYIVVWAEFHESLFYFYKWIYGDERIPSKVNYYNIETILNVKSRSAGIIALDPYGNIFSWSFKYAIDPNWITNNAFSCPTTLVLYFDPFMNFTNFNYRTFKVQDEIRVFVRFAIIRVKCA